MLEDKLRAQLAQKDLLLMPHLVLGAPSFAENEVVIDEMIAAGAEIIEMQIPFSEAMADGPVIMKANDIALKNGTTTTPCLAFAKKMAAKHPDAIFLFMTYYNILFAYGLEKFFEAAKDAGIEGLIVPDLPPEEGDEFLALCDKHGIAPILIFPPTDSDARLKELDSYAKGMAYCVGRKGVTGLKTKMDDTLLGLIKRYRAATKLPLALGFGLQQKADVDMIKGHADIAVIGTQLLIIHEEQGAKAVGDFLRSLRA